MIAAVVTRPGLSTLRRLAAGVAALLALATTTHATSPPPSPIPAPPNTAISFGPHPSFLPITPAPPTALPYSNPQQSTVWSVDKLQIMLSENGHTPAVQFFAKGVNYEPTQIGGSADFPPHNDFFFDTGVGTWAGLWNRDIPIMRALGVNTLRTYGWWKWDPSFNNGDQIFGYWPQIDFTTNDATGTFTNPTNSGDVLYPHATHETFLDMCWNGGNSPIFVWIGISISVGQQFLNPAPSPGDQVSARQFALYTAMWAAAKYGNHPAVIGFVIGNEQNQNAGGGSPGTTPTSDFWAFQNQMNALIKAIAPTKLTMSVFTDDPNVWNTTINDGGIYQGKTIPSIYRQDVWGLNPYNDPTVGGGILPRYQQDIVTPSSGAYIKPLLFTEWGVPSSTHTYDGSTPYPLLWTNTAFPPPNPTLLPGATSSPPGSPLPASETDNTTPLGTASIRNNQYLMTSSLTGFFTGVPTGTALPAADQGDWVTNFWGVVKANVADNSKINQAGTTNFASGGYIFEWIDEWWKNGNPTQKDAAVATGANNVFPGGWDDEEYFGMMVGALSGRTCTAGLNNCPLVDTSTGTLNGNPDTLSPRAALVALQTQYTSTSQLVSAALPGGRSVQVGQPATVFGAIINASPDALRGCFPAMLTSVPATFSYQTTDPGTNALIGTADTPATIAPGAVQTFVLAFTPTAAFGPAEIQVGYDCAHADPAPIVSGLNTVLLSAATTPGPDVVAVSLTPTNDGIASIAGAPGAGAFAVALANVGVAGTVRVSADTNGVALPLTLSLCPTFATGHPQQGQCSAPPSLALDGMVLPAGGTASFAVFAAVSSPVIFDPAHHRIFVRVTDPGAVVRGWTSVAVRTVP